MDLKLEEIKNQELEKASELINKIENLQDFLTDIQGVENSLSLDLSYFVTKTLKVVIAKIILMFFIVMLSM